MKNLRTISLKCEATGTIYKVSGAAIIVNSEGQLELAGNIEALPIFHKGKLIKDLLAILKTINSSYNSLCISCAGTPLSEFKDIEKVYRTNQAAEYLPALYRLLQENNLDKNFEPVSLEDFNEYLLNNLAYNILDYKVASEFVKVKASQVPKAKKGLRAASVPKSKKAHRTTSTSN